MPLGLPPNRCFCIMDDGDEPVPILSDVKDNVAIHKIDILEDGANFREIVPSHRLYDTNPRSYFIRCIREGRHCLAQMLACNDMH